LIPKTTVETVCTSGPFLGGIDHQKTFRQHPKHCQKKRRSVDSHDLEMPEFPDFIEALPHVMPGIPIAAGAFDGLDLVGPQKHLIAVESPRCFEP
jgi:hypothetical protein